MAADSGSSGFLNEPTARTLAAGDLQAVFLPAHGMLGASLRHKGVEILGRLEDLEAAAAKGSTAGIPFLHPWANRLAAPRYDAAGRQVVLDVSSPMLHLDEHGLPMHGVPWSLLRWEVIEARPDFLGARLEWSGADLLGVFPFPHRVEMAATIRSDALTLETTIAAGSQGPVPISFGFHPYLSLAGLSREHWHLELPAMRKLVLDGRGVPSGADEPFAGFNAQLGERGFDDGFALIGDGATFSVAGAARRVSVDLLEGYPYAQVFAPRDKDYIALEPMTAPASALTTGRGLRLVGPGERFRAKFAIRISAAE
jgi:aldose 1-epimerase